MPKTRNLIALLAFASLPVAAACSESPGNTTETRPSTSATATPGDRDKLVQWMECMNSNGVKVEDPRDSGRMTAEDVGVSKDKLAKAQEACREFVDTGAGDKPNANDPSVLDKYLKYAQCLRDNGVDIPDPTADANGDIKLEPKTDQNTPLFKEAETKCKPLLPGGPGGAR